MEKPKNRRKNYRFFENFDYLKYKGEWFVRFPNEREHIYFGEDRAKRFESTIMQEIKRLDAERKPIYVDGIDQPIIMTSVPVDLRLFATETAKRLLSEL